MSYRLSPSVAKKVDRPWEHFTVIVQMYTSIIDINTNIRFDLI